MRKKSCSPFSTGAAAESQTEITKDDLHRRQRQRWQADVTDFKFSKYFTLTTSTDQYKAGKQWANAQHAEVSSGELNAFIIWKFKIPCRCQYSKLQIFRLAEKNNENFMEF